MGKTAGSYIPEAISRTVGKGQLAPELRNPKIVIFAPFFFQVLRLTFFFGAAYSYYNNSPGLAWLLGILLVHSFLDPQCYMKPNLMHAYLVFTVVFYYCRWVMGWGQVGLTVYKEDAPVWVKVLKDIVWVGVYAVFGFRALTRPKFDHNMPLWFTPRGMVLVLLAFIYFALPTLSLIYARGSMLQIVLDDMRYPLEYVPLVFLFPFILRGKSSIRYLRVFVPLIILSLLFFGVERFSGRQTGFGGWGLYARYGSIFGAPNDFGMFMTVSITAFLAFLAEKAIRWSLKLVALLGVCVFALASTVSLSAIFSMVFSAFTLVLFARNKVKSAVSVLAVVVLAAGLYFAFPSANVPTYLRERLEDLTTLKESSENGHYVSIVQAEEEIARFEPLEYVVGTLKSRKDLVLPETYYLRTFYVRGGISLLIQLSIISLTLFEANRRYRAALGNPQRRALFLTTFLGVAAYSFAALFIPYFDIFPSNFYFWFLTAIIWCEPMNEKEVAATHVARPHQLVGARGQRLATRLGG